MTRWTNPFRDLMEMQERMNRLLEETERRGMDFEREDVAAAVWRPAADLIETKTHVLLLVELPGVAREQMRLDLDRGRLTLQGERPVPADIEGIGKGQGHIRERVYGPFSRTFDLPAHVDEEKIEAIFKAGVLMVRIPKDDPQKARRVEIG